MFRSAVVPMLFLVPALVTAGMLLMIFPHMSGPLLALSIFLPAIGALIWWQLRLLKERGNTGVKAGGVTVLFLGCLFGFCCFYFTSRTNIYITNGTDADVTVEMGPGGRFTIPAHEFRRVDLGIGPLTASWNGKTHQLRTTQLGRWVLNLDTAETFIRMPVQYSALPSFAHSRTGGSAPDFEAVRGEFFYADADYVFEIPRSIEVKSGDFSTVRKVLLRPADLVRIAGTMSEERDPYDDFISKGIDTEQGPADEPDTTVVHFARKRK